MTVNISGGHREAPGQSTACPGNGGMQAIRDAQRIIREGGASAMALSNNDVQRIADAVAGITVPEAASDGRDVRLTSALKWSMIHARNGRNAAREAPEKTATEVANIIVPEASSEGNDWRLTTALKWAVIHARGGRGEARQAKEAIKGRVLPAMEEISDGIAEEVAGKVIEATTEADAKAIVKEIAERLAG